jgi:hypothetical protein
MVAVMRRFDEVALQPEQHAQRLRAIFVVVHDENSPRH